MSSQTHVCDACGGNGLSENAPEMNHAWWVVTWDHICPVCLGAGRFPDRMPVADAVADAETLKRNAIAWQTLPVQSSAYRTALWLNRTTIHGRHAARLFDRDSAVNAARAAFRAVPGLRGDK